MQYHISMLSCSFIFDPALYHRLFVAIGYLLTYFLTSHIIGLQLLHTPSLVSGFARISSSQLGKQDIVSQQDISRLHFDDKMAY